MERPQNILNMMKREGDTSSHEWTGANDDGITEAEVKSPRVKEEMLHENLDLEKMPGKHREHAEEIIRSHPSEAASNDGTRRYAADAQGEANTSNRTQHKGHNNVNARTAKCLTSVRRPSPSPSVRRPSPSPLRRRNEPVLRRWSRTRDAKRASELRENDSRYTWQRSKDIASAEVRTCANKQTTGAQQRAANDLT